MSSQNIVNIAELVIVGGCRGVGKTTLAKQYCSERHVAYKHPGDWFVRYLYEIDSKLIEGIAVHDILAAPKPVFVDIHYATYVKPKGWVQGLCNDSLKLLGEQYKDIALYLVEVDEETLYRRRLVDLHKKKRKLEKGIITEELRQNSEAFEHYVAILAQYTKVTAQRIVNTSLEESLRTLNCCYTL